ncbi:hypothetical protein EJ05DRAFT_487465 [Pseudovirgaria hyperparasitica]|uniref:DUF3176 domain-containing protein n=1 Tax=Pseudovirgaria hyperparasitica TaxID=470096 RepID=A0A6A6W3N7_9PEZI|nr:uncharacterized protein EJ05DRAFT_487465 [Pseudovirgaria hyperparasitica]KAF2756586.1 hypothetical protein EJ05DRAFT_487465 [Pseudovirgaria hyperparasitica]
MAYQSLQGPHLDEDSIFQEDIAQVNDPRDEIIGSRDHSDSRDHLVSEPLSLHKSNKTPLVQAKEDSRHHWSNSTSTTVDKPESGSLRSWNKVPRLRKSDTWTLEIISLTFGLGAVAAIIGVMSRFNGRALPEWPYYITLNALIALLATIANATLSVSLSSGISQSKWIRFKTSDAPLSDMEVFDDASRGTWGSIVMLTTGRGGLLGSFGAVIAILGLALGPFAQQVAAYRTRWVESDVGAEIPRALNFTPALMGNTSTTGFVPILPLKAAVYNGLFAENNRPVASLPFNCQSGNCIWEPYESLAVCHECVDISSLMTRYCPPEFGPTQNISQCGWQIPQGGQLNTSSDVFSMTSFIPSAYGDMPHSTLIRIIFMGTEYQDTPEQLNPWAKQCTLQTCVNTLHSTVTNGTLSENTSDSVLNHTVLDISSPSETSDYGVYIKGTFPTEPPFLLSMGALLSIRGWFSAIFANGSATRTTSDFTRSITDPDRAVVVNLTVGISSGETFFDSDIVTAFYWNYYEYADGLNMLMSDLAVSMTTAFRGFNGAVPVQGKALSAESYVHVRWGFVVLPVAVVFLTVAFLVAAMLSTRATKTTLWKSSALAVLLHGLDQETREKFVLGDGLHKHKRQAKNVRVRLDVNSEKEVLLRGCGTKC